MHRVSVCISCCLAQVVITETARSFAHFITSVSSVRLELMRDNILLLFFVKRSQCPCLSVGIFLLKVCAIIGGVFTVTGLVDSVVYHSTKAMKKD